MELGKFYGDEYRWELDRRDQLNASVNIPVSIIAVLFGALAVFFQDLKSNSGYISIEILFYVSLAVSTWFVWMALHYLIKSFHSPIYHMINDSNTYRVWDKQVRAILENEPERSAKTL
jgi:hypothetical protein